MNAIELKGVRKSYNGRAVLDIDSVIVKQGSRVALVGSNGSGKTTLMTIAALLMQPDQGEVLVEGRQVNPHQAETLRTKIAFATQEPYFFRGSLAKNMAFALCNSGLSKDSRSEQIEKSLSMLGIGGLATRSPRAFSSGERKRAAVARAMCRETPILLLDEPFTHMDHASASVLVKVLGDLPPDRTLVFSTHDLGDAYRLADTIVTLQDGKLSPWTPENIYQMRAKALEDGFELTTSGGLAIYYPGSLQEGRMYTVSLNAYEVLVSREKIESSARNSYRGEIRRIENAGMHTVLITVECPPDFPVRATITERSMRAFALNVGDRVWVHFKSTAVHVFE